MPSRSFLFLIREFRISRDPIIGEALRDVICKKVWQVHNFMMRKNYHIISCMMKDEALKRNVKLNETDVINGIVDETFASVLHDDFLDSFMKKHRNEWEIVFHSDPVPQEERDMLERLERDFDRKVFNRITIIYKLPSKDSQFWVDVARGKPRTIYIDGTDNEIIADGSISAQIGERLVQPDHPSKHTRKSLMTKSPRNPQFPFDDPLIREAVKMIRNEKHREVLNLKNLEKKSLKEIAAILGESETNAKQLHRRAKRALLINIGKILAGPGGAAIKAAYQELGEVWNGKREPFPTMFLILSLDQRGCQAPEILDEVLKRHFRSFYSEESKNPSKAVLEALSQEMQSDRELDALLSSQASLSPEEKSTAQDAAIDLIKEALRAIPFIIISLWEHRDFRKYLKKSLEQSLYNALSYIFKITVKEHLKFALSELFFKIREKSDNGNLVCRNRGV